MNDTYKIVLHKINRNPRIVRPNQIISIEELRTYIGKYIIICNDDWWHRPGLLLEVTDDGFDILVYNSLQKNLSHKTFSLKPYLTIKGCNWEEKCWIEKVMFPMNNNKKLNDLCIYAKNLIDKKVGHILPYDLIQEKDIARVTDIFKKPVDKQVRACETMASRIETTQKAIARAFCVVKYAPRNVDPDHLDAMVKAFLTRALTLHPKDITPEDLYEFSNK